MRKVALFTAVAVVVPSLALAAGNHPMGGCGLGYLLLSNKDNTKVTQVLGATTNGTFGSQTFGISSGTSGCTEDGAVKFARATEVFAEVNLTTLRHEMAAGQGEYVNAFAGLLGASETNRPALVSFLQTEYQSLFPTAQTSATDMLSALSAKLSSRPELLG
jgi:hypothetical protein